MSELSLVRNEAETSLRRVFPSAMDGRGSMKMFDSFLPSGNLYLDRVAAARQLKAVLNKTTQIMHEDSGFLPPDELKRLEDFRLKLEVLLEVTSGQQIMQFYFTSRKT